MYSKPTDSPIQLAEERKFTHIVISSWFKHTHNDKKH